MRAQAYASLAAFPLGTLEGISALRPLGAYAALLRRELLHQAGPPAGGGQPRRQRQHATQALAECEALVQAALAHEHATRRRPGAAGGAAGRERGGAAVATGSGAAAASHRLQSVLPRQLLGGAAGTAADLLQRLPGVPAVAVLLFYAPSPPPAGGSKAAAAAAARHAAADYQAVFEEVLRQQLAVLPAAEDAGAAAECLAACTAFLRRWLAAVRAAAKQQAAEQQQAAADAALQVWVAVQQQLESSSATPAAVANAVWAAAALVGCTPQPVPALVSAVHASLNGMAKGGPQHSAAAQRAALAALGSIAEAARVTMGAPAVQQTLQLMQQQLSSQPHAALTGLGLACAALGSSVSPAAGAASNLPAAAEQLLRAGLASLVAQLCMAWPAAATGIGAAAGTAGLELHPAPAPTAAQPEELLPAAAAALAAALPAAAAALPMPSLLQALHQQLALHLSSQQSAPTSAALCSLAQAVAAAGFKAGALSSADAGQTLSSLLQLAGTSGSQLPLQHGALLGAAASAAGGLLAALLQQGFTPAAEQTAAAVVQLLLALPEAAGKLPQAAAAKRGAAAGIAALLASAAVDPDSPQCKAAGALSSQC